MIRVRQMDVHTQRILMLQFQVARDMWKCTGTQCRANVSVWNAKCDKCGRNRVYGPSNTKIEARSWLCSLYVTVCFNCAASVSSALLTAFCDCAHVGVSPQTIRPLRPATVALRHFLKSTDRLSTHRDLAPLALQHGMVCAIRNPRNRRYHGSSKHRRSP